MWPLDVDGLSLNADFVIWQLHNHFVSVSLPVKCKTTCLTENVSVQFSSVTQPCPTLCDPMDCSTPGLPLHHQLPEFTQTHVHWVSDAIQPSHPLSPLLLPPSIFPSITVFFNESILCIIRWPKYWSFSFSISPSNEYSGLISFRMDWLDLLAKCLAHSSHPLWWLSVKNLPANSGDTRVVGSILGSGRSPGVGNSTTF